MIKAILGAGVTLCSVLAAPLASAAENSATWTLQNTFDNDNLTIKGSFRTRYEGINGEFRPGVNENLDVLALKTDIFAEYNFGSFRIGGELMDARSYSTGIGDGINGGIVNALEPVQSYIAFSFGDASHNSVGTGIKLGRFDLSLGSKRLVGRTGFGNTIHTYTGARFDLKQGDQSATFFYTLPNQVKPSGQESLLDNEIDYDDPTSAQKFWGGFYTNTGLIPGAQLEAYVYGLNEKDKIKHQTKDRDLYTIGGRLKKNTSPSTLGYEIELAYQTGHRSTSAATNAEKMDVDAIMAHATVAYQLDTPWKPRLAAEFDYASGAGEKEGQNNRFDNLFGLRRGDFGPVDIDGIIPRSNIISPGVRLSVAPNTRWNAFTSYRAVWLADKTDAFISGIRDETGQSGSFAGQQLEVAIRYWLIPDVLQAEVGGSHFFNGRFMNTAPNATGNGDTNYGYADITFHF
jgi:hypothetical protein